MANKDLTLDPTARAFLGTHRDGAVEIVQRAGQKVKVEAVLDAEGRWRHEEACDFGNSLVQYVAMHEDLSVPQRVWGFSLASMCLREDYPDGTEVFDTLYESAEADLDLPGHPLTAFDEDERLTRVAKVEPMDEATLRAAAQFSEKVYAYIMKKRLGLGLHYTQAAYAIGRAFHNLRRTFPDALGGHPAFDEYVSDAGKYFANNKDKRIK